MTRKPLVTVTLAAMTMLLYAGWAGADVLDDEGMFVFLDAAFSTPGNTDQVVAQTIDAGNAPQTSADVISLDICTSTIATACTRASAGYPHSAVSRT